MVSLQADVRVESVWRSVLVSSTHRDRTVNASHGKVNGVIAPTPVSLPPIDCGVSTLSLGRRLQALPACFAPALCFLRGCSTGSTVPFVNRDRIRLVLRLPSLAKIVR